jgi:hypothetical protein
MRNIIIRVSAIVTLLVTVAFASALASVSAQTPGHNISANIPFDFNVGDKTLPAGRYAIGRINGDGSQLSVSNREDSATRLTQTVQSSEPKEQTVLVFMRYGDRYFLSQVWTAGESVGRQMLRSKGEKAIEQELAKKNEKAEAITVAALR